MNELFFVPRVGAWAEPDIGKPAAELLVALDAGSAAPTEVVAGTAFPVMDAQDAERAAADLAAGLDAALQVPNPKACCAEHLVCRQEWVPCESTTLVEAEVL